MQPPPRHIEQGSAPSAHQNHNFTTPSTTSAETEAPFRGMLSNASPVIPAPYNFRPFHPESHAMDLLPSAFQRPLVPRGPQEQLHYTAPPPTLQPLHPAHYHPLDSRSTYSFPGPLNTSSRFHGGEPAPFQQTQTAAVNSSAGEHRFDHGQSTYDRDSVRYSLADIRSQIACAGPSRLESREDATSRRSSGPLGTPTSPTGFAYSPASTEHSLSTGYSDRRVPSVASNIPGGSASAFMTVQPSKSDAGKYRLHVREPRGRLLAARRSTPKDRRPVDPPIILQLQILDFDPKSEEHIQDLQDGGWVVKCELYNEEGTHRVSSLDERTVLWEGYVANRLFLEEDPDPKSALLHPSSSPQHRPPLDRSYRKAPVSLFVFDNLHIRLVGNYKLKFQLMRMTDLSTEEGSATFIKDTAWSDTIRVCSPLEFTKVQPSTDLFEALVKLKWPGFKRRHGPADRERKRQEREQERQEEEEEAEHEMSDAG